MKTQLKSLASVALGMALAVMGSSAFAKGHDQGVADGSPLLENTGEFSRDGSIAGLTVPGIGGFTKTELCREEYFFCGVVGGPGLTYGRDIVQQQLADDTRRVKPVVNGRR
jgi:hypothetical protein